MEKYLDIDQWKIIETGFAPDRQRASESIFSIGNGHMGQRANFEEQYSGESLQGSYIAGIYYPDKTKVGWWKNGYPEYFAKVLNSVNWIGIDIEVDGQPLDLAQCTVQDFKRTLDMKEGVLKRSFVAELKDGKQVAVDARRFVSMDRPEVGVIDYALKALNFAGTINYAPYINGAVRNQDANYDEMFWSEVDQDIFEDGGYVTTKTKKLDFHVCAGMQCQILKDGRPTVAIAQPSQSSMKISQSYNVSVSENETVSLRKFAVIASSFNHERKRLHRHVQDSVQGVASLGFEQLLEEHRKS